MPWMTSPTCPVDDTVPTHSRINQLPQNDFMVYGCCKPRNPDSQKGGLENSNDITSGLSGVYTKIEIGTRAGLFVHSRTTF
eukprot:6482074-Amphidinium_carterae.1